tara:strand:+ start:1443 stop:3257 length:1815 start_codon:yes stop_codon:yes gene_type:complete
MQRLFLYILSLLSFVLFSQDNNKFIRQINLESLGVIDDYATCAKLWGPSDANSFYKLFNQDAQVFVDISQSDDFGTQVRFSDYINIIKNGKSSSMIGVTIKVLEIQPIMGNVDTGSVSLIVEKTLSTKFKKIGILAGNDFGERKEKIKYSNQKFVLKFDLNFSKNSRFFELKKIKNLTDDEKEELDIINSYLFQINRISLYEDKEKSMPVITYMKSFPYISSGKWIEPKIIESEKTVIDPLEPSIRETYKVIYGCTDSRAINYNSQATENDGSCLILSINNKEIIPQGDNIKYFILSDNNQKNIYSLSNPIFAKGKLDVKGEEYYSLNFRKRIDYVFLYSSLVSSKFSSDFINVKNSWESNPKYLENMNFSIGIYPTNNDIGKGLSYKIGVKMSKVSSEISFTPFIADYTEPDLDDRIGGLGYSYNRLYRNIEIDNEKIEMNRNSIYLSSQLSFLLFPGEKMRGSLYTKLNIALLNLRTASFNSQGNATILGDYSPSGSQTFHDVVFGAGVFDFGSHNLTGSGNLNTSVSSLDLSSISFGIEYVYGRLGTYFEVDTEISSAKNFFVDKNTFILENPSDGFRSLTSITNSVISNTYLSVGLNFKL